MVRDAGMVYPGAQGICAAIQKHLTRNTVRNLAVWRNPKQ